MITEVHLYCRSVHVTKFLADKTRLFSGSDDNSVSVWDIPSEKELISYKKHQVRWGLDK